MKSRLLIIALISFSTGPLFAQNVIIKQDVNKDFEEENRGPNKTYYTSNISGFGLIFGNPDSAGSSIDPFKSFYYENGRRSKHQFGSFFALGHESSINIFSYYLNQDSTKTFGGSALHKAERFFQINGNVAIYARFNFMFKRGNHLGRYLDIFTYGEYAFLTRHMIKDRIEEGNGYKYVRSWYRGMDNLNRLNYGLGARIGFAHLLFFVKYRYSNLFHEKSVLDYEELPRFVAGISFDVPNFTIRKRQ